MGYSAVQVGKLSERLERVVSLARKCSGWSVEWESLVRRRWQAWWYRRTGNARFWVWDTAGESWVKLTLRPGQSVSRAAGAVTQEGYWCALVTWTHEGDGVRRVNRTTSRDCDGLHDDYSEWFAGLGELAVVPVEDSGVMTPLWRDGESSQRDYTAEAAGY